MIEIYAFIKSIDLNKSMLIQWAASIKRHQNPIGYRPSHLLSLFLRYAISPNIYATYLIPNTDRLNWSYFEKWSLSFLQNMRSRIAMAVFIQHMDANTI